MFINSLDSCVDMTIVAFVSAVHILTKCDTPVGGHNVSAMVVCSICLDGMCHTCATKQFEGEMRQCLAQVLTVTAQRCPQASPGPLLRWLCEFCNTLHVV